jgi:hypothetical protein
VRPDPCQQPPGAAAAKGRRYSRSARHRPRADHALLRLGAGRRAGRGRGDGHGQIMGLSGGMRLRLCGRWIALFALAAGACTSAPSAPAPTATEIPPTATAVAEPTRQPTLVPATATQVLPIRVPPTPVPPTLVPTAAPRPRPSVSDAINAALTDHEGSIGVVFRSLTTGQTSQPRQAFHVGESVQALRAGDCRSRYRKRLA